MKSVSNPVVDPWDVSVWLLMRPQAQRPPQPPLTATRSRWPTETWLPAGLWLPSFVRLAWARPGTAACWIARNRLWWRYVPPPLPPLCVQRIVAMYARQIILSEIDFFICIWNVCTCVMIILLRCQSFCMDLGREANGFLGCSGPALPCLFL